jgi:hypothetical protein
MHAWLAQYPAFTSQVIAGDPMGVIEYADVDNLTAEQGRRLLQALQLLAKRNPDFRGRGQYSLRGIVQPALVEDVRALLTDPDTPFGLQMLLPEALRTAPIWDFVSDLITRRLAAGTIEPAKLWYWLLPFDADGGGNRKTREKLTQLLQRDAVLRLRVLRHVLLEKQVGSTLAARFWCLLDRSSGFAATPDEIVALLSELDPTDLADQRWRDLVQLTRHDHENGAAMIRRFSSTASHAQPSSNTTRLDWAAASSIPF